MAIEPEKLLYFADDLLRTMPPLEDFLALTNESARWVGQASAVFSEWDSSKFRVVIERELLRLSTGGQISGEAAYRKVRVFLEQMRASAYFASAPLQSVAISRGSVFDYFDEVRQIIESAGIDLLFVDPYLDADFVGRFLPFAKPAITIRLLTREKLSTLVPAVSAFTQQSGANISIRAGSRFHDRYLFVDRTRCYQSGASFKDGARNAPTTLTQVTDAFTSVLATYEELWEQSPEVEA